MSLPIVIIGAGLSGLLTGYKLKKLGFVITILEARARTGGRIHTVKGLDGTPMEMGATWFGPQHLNLKDLLEELEIPRFEQYNAGVVMFQASSLGTAPAYPNSATGPQLQNSGGNGPTDTKADVFF